MPDFQTLLLSPGGRLGRRDFLLAGAALVAVGIVGHALPVVGPALQLLLLWPWTCLSAKRLHDMGRPAHWVALPIVPAALVAVLALFATAAPVGVTGATLATAALAALIGLVALLVGLGFLLWVALTPGEAGANRWGEPARPLLAA